MWYKTNLFWATFLTVIAAIGAWAGDGVGDYSEGYRMGLLYKFSTPSDWPLMHQTGEGELMLGKDSSFREECSGSGKDKTCKQINPWLFSSDPAKKDEIEKFMNQYVVIHYHQARIAGYGRRTDYSVREIFPVDDKSAHDQSCTINPDALPGTRSAGQRTARIVKVSYKGTVNKSYEAILQEGGTGNQFLNMSIADENMFKCAVDWLKSGRVATVWYKQSYVYNFANRDSSYEIFKIDVPQKSQTLKD